MEGILGFLVVVIFFGVLLGGFQFLAGKYFGMKIHGKYQFRNAVREEEMVQQQLHLESQIDIEEGIKRCKKKNYTPTASNILSEISKIKKERNNDQAKESNVKGIKAVLSSIVKDKKSNTLDKLERLNNLKVNGTITESEFLELKKEILSSNVPNQNFDFVDTDKQKIDEFYRNAKEFIHNDAKAVITQLYFEFKDEFKELKDSGDQGLIDLLMKVHVNDKYAYVSENYKRISQLYYDGIISKDEFHEKKRIILLNSIKAINS